MTTALQLLHPEEELNPQSLLIETLKSYPEKTVHSDGTVTTEYIETNYFLENDTWNIDFFFKIKQFQLLKDNYPKKGSKNFDFHFENEDIKIEFKFLIHHLIFEEKWKLTGGYGMSSPFRKLISFLNEKHPEYSSLLDMDIDKVQKEWIFWLNDNKVSTVKTQIDTVYGELKYKSVFVNFIKSFYTLYTYLSDEREEWEKDRWDIRVLNQKYGLDYNKSTASYYIDFRQIINLNFKNNLKKYLKHRLLSRNNFSVGTARSYSFFVSHFLNYIIQVEPTWDNLNELKRQHIEGYICYINEYVQSNLTRKGANPQNYILKAVTYVDRFLTDIQFYEYDIAPKISMHKLIYSSDKPKLPKKSADKIDYIPDFVLEQLFKNINDLHPDMVPIIYTAFKTGLRISDVLGLKTDCLVRIKEKYYIQTDIQKIQIKGHRIPIDDELANLLAVEIKRSIEYSNQDNNPDNYIFVCYHGRRKGKPYSQGWIRGNLNQLAVKHQIKDESGNLFWFKMHQFRHTYGVKLLNNGADILVVQELLAHASPEMTLTYAKLLDDTKRKAFDEVIKQGVFSFDNGDRIVQYQPGDDIPEEILETLYRDHKLTAMDNPYGTCHARIKGDCPYMDEPPCLTCNGGKPCNHLAIGFSEDDTQKYELLVKTTSRSIQYAEQYGREDIKEKNQKNLETYQSILDTLQKGDIIFGNLERLKRKRGESNV